MITRRPTGIPSWPITLIAGAEKTGKSYAAAVASASEHVGRTLWVSVGEDDPDEYGAIPGAEFEIVVHDGTYRGILDALTWCVNEPPVDGKPTLLVVDSMSRLWNLLGDMAQAEANTQARRRAEQQKRPVSLDDADITVNLWNTAAQRWGHVMDQLRAHKGPVVCTARLDVVTVMDAQGRPTKAKDRKVIGHKSLPFDVAAIVELGGVGVADITGVRSLRFKPEPGTRTPFPDFTVEGLWQRMGCLDTTGARAHSSVHAETDWDRAIEDAKAGEDPVEALRVLYVRAKVDPDRDVVRERIQTAVNELNVQEEGP